MLVVVVVVALRVLRLIARKIASTSTEHNNNHKNNINSCNDDERFKQCKRKRPLAWAVLENKDRHHASCEVKLGAVFLKDKSPEIVAAVLTAIQCRNSNRSNSSSKSLHIFLQLVRAAAVAVVRITLTFF